MSATGISDPEFREILRDLCYAWVERKQIEGEIEEAKRKMSLLIGKSERSDKP